jgi:hypothetical protein
MTLGQQLGRFKLIRLIGRLQRSEPASRGN